MVLKDFKCWIKKELDLRQVVLGFYLYRTFGISFIGLNQVFVVGKEK